MPVAEAVYGQVRATNSNRQISFCHRFACAVLQKARHSCGEVYREDTFMGYKLMDRLHATAPGIIFLTVLPDDIAFRTLNLCLPVGAFQHFVSPRNEVFYIGGVGVAAIVLPPGQFPIQQTHIHAGHLCGFIIVRHPKASCTQ